jgi:hypothetical protein
VSPRAGLDAVLYEMLDTCILKIGPTRVYPKVSGLSR